MFVSISYFVIIHFSRMLISNIKEVFHSKRNISGDTDRFLKNVLGFDGKLHRQQHHTVMVWFMVFNTTFNNISVILWLIFGLVHEYIRKKKWPLQVNLNHTSSSELFLVGLKYKYSLNVF